MFGKVENKEKIKMEELRKLVKELEQLTDKKEIVAKLQEIGAELINKYEIKVGSVTIEPLLVEAYYYDEEKFPDDSVHAAKESDALTYELARKRQCKHENFGELYFHYGTKGSDGIDIVLSCGEYYLSYLIKNALVNKKFKKQTGIPDVICEECQEEGPYDCHDCFDCRYYGKSVLKKSASKGYEIVSTRRRGLTNDYACAPLGMLPIDKIKEYEFTPGQSITDIIRKYIKSEFAKGDYNEEWLKELAAGKIDWNKLKK